MYIAILGRLPELSIAELESRFGSNAVDWFSKTFIVSHTGTATIETDTVSIEQLGGTTKAGRVVLDLPKSDWRRVSETIVKEYSKSWSTSEGKITLGISAYNFDKVSSREVQRIGILIKQNLKKHTVSLRVIPNTEPSLNTATSHHNKLGLSPNKIELLIVRGDSGRIIVAESTGAQNITALAARDQARPKRDAFVGMLPPKLALMMVNLAAGARQESLSTSTTPRLLDAFCGTGVILQEAALLGYDTYGTDLSDKMIDYTRGNLEWLQKTRHLAFKLTSHQGDAMTTKWQQPIDLVVSETYLGQPFNTFPGYDKIEQIRRNCSHILSDFLANLAPQIKSGTPVCIATPVWFEEDGRMIGPPPIHTPHYRPGNYELSEFSEILKDAGYTQVTFKNVRPKDLIYYRSGQVVGRELIIMTKT